MRACLRPLLAAAKLHVSILSYKSREGDLEQSLIITLSHILYIKMVTITQLKGTVHSPLLQTLHIQYAMDNSLPVTQSGKTEQEGHFIWNRMI